MNLKDFNNKLNNRMDEMAWRDNNGDMARKDNAKRDDGGAMASQKEKFTVKYFFNVQILEVHYNILVDKAYIWEDVKWSRKDFNEFIREFGGKTIAIKKDQKRNVLTGTITRSPVDELTNTFGIGKFKTSY
jgi:hypothetical protein